MSQTPLLTREPVINKRRTITANRLVVHAAHLEDAASALSALHDVWPEQHTVFVSFARLVPTPALEQWTPPPNTLLEIPAQTLAHPRTLALLPALQERQTPCCLSWFTPGQTPPAELDWRFAIIDARRHPACPEAPGIPLAWGLKDIGAFQDAVQGDYEGASGWFFLHGLPASRTLSPGHAQILRLLNLVRANADIVEIEALLKQDVAISYKLLRYINSAGFGLMCEIQSFRHAVSILGYEALNKWLSLLLVTASRDPHAPALMQASITRGRFMEQIGAEFFDKSHHDNLFITGAFSMLPQLLGAPMQALLDEMNLPLPVTEALLHDSGEYAPFLDLARHTESFEAEALRTQAEQLGIATETINRALLSALGFADALSA